MHVGGTVKAKVRHAIDRGGGAQSARRRRTRSTVAKEEKWGKIDRKKNSSPRRTVVTLRLPSACQKNVSSQSTSKRANKSGSKGAT